VAVPIVKFEYIPFGGSLSDTFAQTNKKKLIVGFCFAKVPANIKIYLKISVKPVGSFSTEV
jgi:hypothetical protein